MREDIKLIIADGGLYFRYLNYIREKNIKPLNSVCVFGDAISMVDLPLLKQVLRITEQQKENIICCFPEILPLRVCGESLQKLSETEHNFHISDNLYNIIASAKKNINGETIYFGTGYENAGITIAVGLIRAVMAGITNFKVLGKFYSTPHLINLLNPSDTDKEKTYFIMPHEFLQTSSKVLIEKACAKKNYIPVFISNTDGELEKIIDNICQGVEVYNTIVQPQIDLAQYDQFQNILNEVFSLPDEDSNSALLQPKDKYQHFFMAPEIQNDERDFLPSCKKVVLGMQDPLSCEEFCKGNCHPENPVSPLMISSKGVCRIAHYFDKLKKNS